MFNIWNREGIKGGTDTKIKSESWYQPAVGGARAAAAAGN